MFNIKALVLIIRKIKRFQVNFNFNLKIAEVTNYETIIICNYNICNFFVPINKINYGSYVYSKCAVAWFMSYPIHLLQFLLVNVLI